MPELANTARGYAVGKTLYVSEDGHVPHGATVWQRLWSPVHVATAWPPAGPFDSIIMQLPRGKATLRFCLHAAASVLAADGKLILFGENDLGIKSADKVAAEMFAESKALRTGGHGRIWEFTKPQAGAAAVTIETFRQGVHPMLSYPGLFADGKLDEATKLLIDNIPAIPAGAKVLDFACGLGPLAGAALAVQPTAKVTAIDNNPLALHAAQQNVPGITTQLAGDIRLVEGKFDIILSNPPIHEGNHQSFRIVHNIISSLPNLLNKGGVAYIVTQVTVPVARLAKGVEGISSTEIAANRSFKVTKLV